MSVSVAVVMPTLPDRLEFLMRAVDCVKHQQHPADWKLSLLMDADPVPTLGAKLNRMIAQCDHDYIILMDDDDVHAPDRVVSQITPLLMGSAPYIITGTSQIIYQELKTGKRYRYQNDGSSIYGLAFLRTAWEHYKFEDISKGVDVRWQKNFKKNEKLDLMDDGLFLGTIHDGNTCKKNVNGPLWTELPA